MITIAAASTGLALAFLTAALFLRNLKAYAPPPVFNANGPRTAVSVLIPARNEEAAIRAAVESALLSQGVTVEVIVLDDHSEDRTAEVVRSLMVLEPRLRLESAPELPVGWCGKQFACSVLARLASHEVLCFVDSDVRLRPQGLARMAEFLRRSNASLISGFPHQELETFFEKLLLPLMHFLLLGFLPIDSMRRYRFLSMGAGCGQLFMAERNAYFRCGGHGAIRASRHDGLTLPKAFRRAGFHTDLFDASAIATCRMYHNAEEVFSGLLKNANEGIAAPLRIFIFTFLLLAGHVLPEGLVLYCIGRVQFGAAFWMAAIATCLSLLPRVLAARRFQQPLFEALLHPLAILVFLALQWQARMRDISGTPAVWKGRFYQTT